VLQFAPWLTTFLDEDADQLKPLNTEEYFDFAKSLK